MKERPILFNAEMVRAILDGRKTQTRRPINPQQRVTGWGCIGGQGFGFISEDTFGDQKIIHCPFGQPGDRLWVRETWRFYDWTEEGEPYIKYRSDESVELRCDYSEEQSDRILDVWADLSAPENYKIDGKAGDRRWRPSIHMPRWASRIDLEIIDVRVDRVCYISLSDICAEGTPALTDNPIMDFDKRWDAIYTTKGLG